MAKRFSTYTVDSIKRTALLKILLLKKTSKNLYQKYGLLLVNRIFNREKSPLKAKCTVRLIESTEYVLHNIVHITY